VTGMRGKRPNIAQAVARNLLRLIDGIVLYLVGAIFMLMTRERQRLGDLVARTVVRVAPAAGAARAGAVIALVALPPAAFGVTWYSGLIGAASNRWMSSIATTRLHGEAGYQSRLEGGIDLGTGQSNVRGAREGYASGEVVNETLIMDSVRFAAGTDGAERPSRVFKPGETAVVSFNLTGIARPKNAPAGSIRTKVRAVTQGGVELVPPAQGDDDVAAGPRRVVPRRVEVALPASCPPGAYHLEIVVEDLLAGAGKHVKATIPFTVAR